MSSAQPPVRPPSRPTGTIRLTVQGSAFSVGLVPTVLVNGYRVNARFGTLDVPVWAGPTRVEAHAQWMRRYGEAMLDVDVPPGAVVPVHYAAPWHQFSRGAIGHEPQSRPGAGFMWVMVAVLVVVLVLVPLAGVFAG